MTVWDPGVPARLRPRQQPPDALAEGNKTSEALSRRTAQDRKPWND